MLNLRVLDIIVIIITRGSSCSDQLVMASIAMSDVKHHSCLSCSFLRLPSLYGDPPVDIVSTVIPSFLPSTEGEEIYIRKKKKDHSGNIPSSPHRPQHQKNRQRNRTTPIPTIQTPQPSSLPTRSTSQPTTRARITPTRPPIRTGQRPPHPTDKITLNHLEHTHLLSNTVRAIPALPPPLLPARDAVGAAGTRLRGCKRRGAQVRHDGRGGPGGEFGRRGEPAGKVGFEAALVGVAGGWDGVVVRVGSGGRLAGGFVHDGLVGACEEGEGGG